MKYTIASIAALASVASAFPNPWAGGVASTCACPPAGQNAYTAPAVTVTETVTQGGQYGYNTVAPPVTITETVTSTLSSGGQGVYSAPPVTVTQINTVTSTVSTGGQGIYSAPPPVTVTEVNTVTSPAGGSGGIESATVTYTQTYVNSEGATVTQTYVNSEGATATQTYVNSEGATITQTYVNSESTTVVPPPTGTASAPATTFTVTVGGFKSGSNGTTPDLTYKPSQVFPKVGDFVKFDFLANNHTVTESTFDNPCEAKEGGFKSGFLPNKADVSGNHVYEIEITDTTPHWVYCGQKLPKPHCQAGMVFAINPTQDKTFDDFKAKALKAPIKPATAVVAAKPAAVTHVVEVGVDENDVTNLVYTPEFISGAVNDLVQFNFRAKNHTLTESTFNNPCTKNPLGGFISGLESEFEPNLNNTDGLLQFSLAIPDEKPHWFYCGQKQPKPHCEAGMVFAINPPATGNTFEKFKAKALALGGHSSWNGTQTATGTGVATGTGIAMATGSGHAYY